MFAINPIACIVALVFETGLFWYLSSRKLQATWGDVRNGLWLTLARFSMMRLSQARSSAGSVDDGTGAPRSRARRRERRTSGPFGRRFGVAAVLSFRRLTGRSVGRRGAVASITAIISSRGSPTARPPMA